MENIDESVQIICWHSKFESIKLVQREYQRHFGKPAPNRLKIGRLIQRFKDTGSVTYRKGSGRPKQVNAIVDRVQNAFENSPRT
jgi:hypothetical protein